MVCFVSLNKSFTFKNKLFTSRSKIKNFTDCGFHDPNKIVFKTEVLDLTIPSTSAGLKQELSDDNSTATVEANHDMTVPSFPIPMITEPSQPQENMSESESSASLTIPEDYFDALEFESMEDIEIKSEIEIEKAQFNVAVEEPEASTSVVSQAHTQFAEPQTMIPEAIIPTFPVYIRYVNKT